METVNGKKMLSAKDPQGNVLFNGPIDTEAQRAQLPAERAQAFRKARTPRVAEGPRCPGTSSRSRTAGIGPPAALACRARRVSPNHRSGWVRSTSSCKRFVPATHL